MKTEFKKYLEYLRPHVELALKGRYNGHNLNRGFYEAFPSKTSEIPKEYNDAVYTILKLLAHSPSSYRIEEKQIKALNFIFEDQEEFKAGSLWGDLSGCASALYFMLKTLDVYLNNITK